MIIADILYRFLPVKVFRQLQKQYHHYKNSIYKPLTEYQFHDILCTMNIEKGDVVFVHSSFDKLYTDFSAKKLLDILIERIGHEGTLLFPSWSYSGRTEEYAKLNEVFDVKKSITRMGLIPELARRKKSSIRSLHPTSSVAAIGKYADELTNTHHLSTYACDKSSPYYKMMKYNAKIIGLGEKSVSMSFLHCIEDVMQNDFPVQLYHSYPIEFKYKDYEGELHKMDVFVHKNSLNPGLIPGFINKNISNQACKQFSNKGRNYFVANSIKLFNELHILAKKGKTIYSL